MFPAFLLHPAFGTHVVLAVGVGLAVGLAMRAMFAFGRRLRLPDHCRRCRFDLHGAEHARCPECGTALDAPRSRVAWRRAPRVGLGIACFLGAIVVFLATQRGADALVAFLKQRAADGLDDRALLERALRPDGADAARFLVLRGGAILEGARAADGSIASLADLRAALDRAEAELPDDAPSDRAMATGSLDAVAVQGVAHLFVADRARFGADLVALALSSDAKDQAFRRSVEVGIDATVEHDRTVRDAFLASDEFVRLAFAMRDAVIEHRPGPSIGALVFVDPAHAYGNIPSFMKPRVVRVRLRCPGEPDAEIPFTTGGTRSEFRNGARFLVSLERPRCEGGGLAVDLVVAITSSDGATREVATACFLRFAPKP